MGDLNLDNCKNKDDNYVHKNLVADFDETLSNLNLSQIVDFVMWSCLVGNELREYIWIETSLLSIQIDEY